MPEPRRPLPRPTPETQHFWDGARRRAAPRSAADACSAPTSRRGRSARTARAASVEIFSASGRATLYSYVIHHRPMPGFTPPYAIAVVALEEGRA